MQPFWVFIFMDLRLILPETGTQTFIASDIIKYLGKSFLSIIKIKALKKGFSKSYIFNSLNKSISYFLMVWEHWIYDIAIWINKNKSGNC
jgi:hypothetical protein